MKRELPLEKQKAKIRSTRMDLSNQSEEEDANDNDTNDRNRLNQQRQQQRGQQPMGGFMGEGLITESQTMTVDDYELLDEAAKRQWKRYGNKMVRKFRCYGGPKNGRMVTKAADCGVKKDPFKVRQGKRSARLKKGQRVRRTQLAKRKAPSKRLTKMNNILRGDK